MVECAMRPKAIMPFMFAMAFGAAAMAGFDMENIDTERSVLVESWSCSPQNRSRQAALTLNVRTGAIIRDGNSIPTLRERLAPKGVIYGEYETPMGSGYVPKPRWDDPPGEKPYRYVSNADIPIETKFTSPGLLRIWVISDSHIFVIKPDTEGIYVISDSGSLVGSYYETWKDSAVLAKYDCKREK